MDVVPLARARELAHEAGLDLVLVSDRSTPPVVRIMNFGKLQYEQKKNLKAQRRNSAAQKLKEVKFHVNIDSHDYETKIKHALDFLDKGCRLKITLALRGREMAAALVTSVHKLYFFSLRKSMTAFVFHIIHIESE